MHKLSKESHLSSPKLKILYGWVFTFHRKTIFCYANYLSHCLKISNRVHYSQSKYIVYTNLVERISGCTILASRLFASTTSNHWHRCYWLWISPMWRIEIWNEECHDCVRGYICHQMWSHFQFFWLWYDLIANFAIHYMNSKFHVLILINGLFCRLWEFLNGLLWLWRATIQLQSQCHMWSTGFNVCIEELKYISWVGVHYT